MGHCYLLSVVCYLQENLLFSSTYVPIIMFPLLIFMLFPPRYGKSREIQTQDLDTTRTLYIQFTFTSGSRNCGGALTAENPILLQFSLDKGITWNLLQTLREPSASSENYHIIIPQEAKYSQTRFRIWQPYAVADNYNIWSIDDLSIGGVDRNIPALTEEFDFIERNT